MSTRTVDCPHVSNIPRNAQAEIERAKEVSTCKECGSQGPNLWICLHRDCFKVGCGEAHGDHSTLHNKLLRSHCVHLNLSTLRVWCYLCEAEVFMEQAVELSDSSDSDENLREDETKPRGLTGLQNIGNTCYMNSAIQALSNSPPLTQFFLEYGNALITSRGGDRKPGLSRSYHRLIQEMWHKKRPGYVVPTSILYGIRNVHPMFRGYQQHDTQEFLRCFMDQLHEELKEPVSHPPTPAALLQGNGRAASFEDLSDDDDSEKKDFGQHEGSCGGASSQSEGEYETCDSGVSERSSLSDECLERRNSGSKLTRVSRSPSPPLDRMRSKIAPIHGNRKKHYTKHRSIISDVFDGKLLSSVQCLTCDRISNRIETFQDLSLPIPSRDHIHMLHKGGSALSTCSDVYVGDQNWLHWVVDWLRSWFWGPTVSLHDCLGAFFSADELKGDNMYSCEKCNKLRNGVKYSKVMELPEILCIHLKRFRHELMSSSKISNYVSFPLTQLDMRPYLHKDCTSSVSSYDLVSVICHHGTAGGGHYTCYALNCQSQQWFEFDDQYVTQVSPETVQNCEAYVLFYRKSCDQVKRFRAQAVELLERSNNEPSLMTFYISKQWLNKLNTFAEPGPIDNSDFLCHHGGVRPDRVNVLPLMYTTVSHAVWECLYNMYGGGPACNRLFTCATCEQEQADLQLRVRRELAVFMQLNKQFLEESTSNIYLISMQWFRQWHSFVREKDCEPPGPIDNTPIIYTNSKTGQIHLKQGSDYAQLSEEMWEFFHGTYGGGPELVLRPTLQKSTSNAPANRSGSRGSENLPNDYSIKSQSTSPSLQGCSQSASLENLTQKMASLISSTQMGSNSSLSGSPPQTCAPSSATSGTSTMSLTSDLQDVKPDLLLLIGKDRECGDDVSHRSSSPTVQDSSKQTQFYCEVDMACPVEL
ncbi:ubiquitin carboxyl-terminal hydrolase 20 isoform X2 [Frankliniella occidentalis]|uniref:Ubiquitin carboxyl-terminal hydrolase n=1 Tax=Frankliniella occidentalis TaxID=133901 RepID=A0A9C6TPD7_FRAOC|nr:ubiquitin carboxyl-terminal hydrolase 20 isoform X2 [Frankliniella occidentalis]